MEFNAWLEAKGFDASTLNDVQLSALKAAWRAEQAPPPAPAPAPPAPAPKPADPRADADLDALLARQRAEQARQKRITGMVAQAAEEHPARIDELEHVGKRAIALGWDEVNTELAILRTCRSSAPLPLRAGVGSGVVLTEKVLEAALCVSSGLRSAEKDYDEQTLDAAHKAFRGGLGLQQVLLVAAQQNGYRSTAAVRSNLKEILSFAFSPRAGTPSTISISGILSNVANKYMRDAFMAVDSAWSEIAARRSVSDFKTITSYSLSGDLTYEEIAPGGKIKSGTLGETSYTNQAKSYGKMLGLDRRDLINDDLGALSTVSKRLGRGGALKLNSVFWGEFLNNTSFFSSGNANVSTGGGSALGLAGLATADQTFRLLTDPDGNLMGVIPAILLVPTALRVTAMNLMSTTTVVSTTTANTPLPDSNAFAGMFKVVSTPYLQDSTLTGYSSAAWYLLANPADVPVIEVAFLNGVEMPTVESADADFDTLGIALRGYHDFGCSKQEYRGGVRSAGS